MMDKVFALLGWLIDNPPWAVGLAAVIALVLWYFLHFKPEQNRAWKQECREVERLTQKQLQEESHQKQLDQRKAAEQKKLADAQRITDLYEQREREAQEQQAQREREAQEQREQREQQEAQEAQMVLDKQAAQEKAGRDFELRIISLINEEFVDWFDTGRAKLLYDVTIYKTQIDAILIDTSGIYVIECKCWKNIILGKTDWEYWFKIKVVFKNGIPVVSKNDQTFYCQAIKSPLSQNEKHREQLYFFLKKEMKHSFKQFKKISVYDTCGNIDFIIPVKPKIDDYVAQFTWLGKKAELAASIRNFDTITPAVSRLSIQEVNSIYDTLKPHAKSSTNTQTAGETEVSLC